MTDYFPQTNYLKHDDGYLFSKHRIITLLICILLVNSGKKAGENIWQMPLQRSYRDGLKSHIADMKNTGPRPGGSITAALFLEEFFDKNINWAHIDIAGTCWADKNKGINPAGATGFGVRTLVQWIKEN